MTPYQHLSQPQSYHELPKSGKVEKETNDVSQEDLLTLYLMFLINSVDLTLKTLIDPLNMIFRDDP